MTKYSLSKATKADLPAIRDLMMDDILTKSRGLTGELASYEKAFAHMEQYPNVNQWVYCDENNKVIGTLQTIIIPSLSLDGATRLEIEGVRIDKTLRGKSLGNKMMQHVFDYAKRENCKIIQLTTNKSRVDSQRFYLKLGFVTSHIGMKYYLNN